MGKYIQYISIEDLNRKRKFTDREYIELYNLGWSDIKIAKKFNCSPSTTRDRRFRLNLIANYPNFSGEILSEEEVKDAQIKRVERMQKYYKKSKYKEKRSIWRKKPEVKKREGDYTKAITQLKKNHSEELREIYQSLK